MQQSVHSPSPSEPPLVPKSISDSTRFLVSLLIGSPLGVMLLIAAFTSRASPFTWWEWTIVGLVLIGAMLVSVLFDQKVRSRLISQTHIALCLASVCLLGGVLATPLIVSPESSPWFFFCALVEIPFATGLAAAFTVGGQDSWREAWDSAFSASIPLFIGFLASLIRGAIALSALPFGGGLICMGGLLAMIVGLGFAVVGGIAGRFLRQQLLYRS